MITLSKEELLRFADFLKQEVEEAELQLPKMENILPDILVRDARVCVACKKNVEIQLRNLARFSKETP